MAGGSVFFVNQLLCFVNVRYLTHKIRKHMRSKNTLVYLGLWEQLNNPNFKGAEFDPLLKEAGSVGTYYSFIFNPSPFSSFCLCK